MVVNINKIKNFIIDALVLLSFTYFPDYIFKGDINDIYKTYCLFINILIILLYIKRNNFKLHFFNIIILVMFLTPVISTIMYSNNNMIEHGIKLTLEMVSLTFYIEQNIKSRKFEFLKNCMIYWGILVIINIFSFYIYFPLGMEGIKNFYFLGNDNGSIYETFLFLFISIVYYIEKDGKIPFSFSLITLFIFLGYLYVDSGNGKACTFIFLLMPFIYKSYMFKKLANTKILTISYLIAFFMLVIWRSNNFIIETILNILKKDPTFTGRTIIWDKSFYWINKHLLIGNGYETSGILLDKILQVKPHNLIIQFLYNGGIIMTVCLIIVLIISLKEKKQLKKENNNNSVLNFCVFMYFIISIFDYYYYKTTLIFILSIIVFIKYFEGEKE